MKVLHFSLKPAFPLIDGGCIAIKSVLKSLISHPDVECVHFTLSTPKHLFFQEAYPKSWRECVKIENCFINTKTNLLDAIIHLLTNKSYNIERFNQKKVKRKLKSLLLENKFDAVVLESVFLLPYAALFKKQGVKVYVRTHNVEHHIWEHLSSDTSVKLKRWYLSKLAGQLKKYELTMLPNVDGIISISQEDTKFFQTNLSPSPKIITLETAVNYPEVPSDTKSNDFYFLGAMDWKPNIEGINWLLKDVFRDTPFPNTFHLAGKALTEYQFAHKGLEVHGEIPNAIDFIKNHGICLIPLKSGSGIKIKLLENMAMGKPIVTTSEGARGVNVVHGTHVLIADTPEAFKEAMLKFMNDEILRKDIGFAAYQFVINNFDENILTNRLVEFITEK
jgi:glycosyltransferase involved in cell wall biosynthesis